MASWWPISERRAWRCLERNLRPQQLREMTRSEGGRVRRVGEGGWSIVRSFSQNTCSRCKNRFNADSNNVGCREVELG